MPEAFPLGDLLIRTLPMAVLAGIGVAIWVSGRLARVGALDARAVRGVAEGAAWTGLAGGRIGFVVVHWPAYAAAPWEALYLWQPGFSALGALGVGGAFALWRAGRAPREERTRRLGAVAGGYAAGAALVGAVGIAMLLPSPAGVWAVGKPIEPFSLATLDGKPARFADLAGRPVVLNFWATWCPPCRREIPLLETAYRRHAGQGLAVVGIDLDEPAPVVAAFLEQYGVTYPVWVDPPAGQPGGASTRELFARSGGAGLPTTVFVARDGTVAGRHLGELSPGVLDGWIRTIAGPGGGE